MTTELSHAQSASLSLKDHKFPYKWLISGGYPAKSIEYHGMTVMTTFACGGGSTMGYKLAGYDVVAANDIDPQMAKVYKANHNPRQFFECSVKELLIRDDLPIVDVLDGSPPCSVFSSAGDREAGWQKDKVFREGQAKQVLDDLFFDFINLVEKMQPKIVVAENVKGMISGDAKWYAREVVRRLQDLEYKCQTFLLNAATMGVPQNRSRVFFIAHKTNKHLELNFNEPPITYKNVRLSEGTEISKVTNAYKQYWSQGEPGGSIGKFKSIKKLHINKVANTINATSLHFDAVEPRNLYKEEIESIGAWPMDYNYCGSKPHYLIGMSVPPVMMAQIALKIKEQLL